MSIETVEQAIERRKQSEGFWKRVALTIIGKQAAHRVRNIGYIEDELGPAVAEGHEKINAILRRDVKRLSDALKQDKAYRQISDHLKENSFEGDMELLTRPTFGPKQ